MNFITFIFLIPTVLSSTVPFEYSEQCEWPQKYPECGGDYQSPIELSCKDAQEFDDVPPMKFHSYSRTIPGGSLILKNTGHTVELTICPHYKLKPKVDGGFLPGVFDFVNIHFHWGSSDRQGAEHILNEKRLSLEMHMVHKNNKYCSLEEASTQKDGVLIISILFKKAGDIKFSPIYNIVDAFEDIVNFGNQTHFDEGFSLASLFPVKKSRYFTYQGSITVPPCSESATWVVFAQYLPISCGELKEFRKLMDCHGEPMVDNYRKTQPVGDRIVVLVK